MIFFSLWFALIKRLCFLPEMSRDNGNSLERQLKLLFKKIRLYKNFRREITVTGTSTLPWLWERKAFISDAMCDTQFFGSSSTQQIPKTQAHIKKKKSHMKVKTVHEKN